MTTVQSIPVVQSSNPETIILSPEALNDYYIVVTGVAYTPGGTSSQQITYYRVKEVNITDEKGVETKHRVAEKQRKVIFQIDADVKGPMMPFKSIYAGGAKPFDMGPKRPMLSLMTQNPKIISILRKLELLSKASFVFNELNIGSIIPEALTFLYREAKAKDATEQPGYEAMVLLRDFTTIPYIELFMKLKPDIQTKLSTVHLSNITKARISDADRFIFKDLKAADDKPTKDGTCYYDICINAPAPMKHRKANEEATEQMKLPSSWGFRIPQIVFTDEVPSQGEDWLADNDPSKIMTGAGQRSVFPARLALWMNDINLGPQGKTHIITKLYANAFKMPGESNVGDRGSTLGMTKASPTTRELSPAGRRSKALAGAASSGDTAPSEGLDFSVEAGDENSD